MNHGWLRTLNLQPVRYSRLGHDQAMPLLVNGARSSVEGSRLKSVFMGRESGHVLSVIPKRKLARADDGVGEGPNGVRGGAALLPVVAGTVQGPGLRWGEPARQLRGKSLT